MTKLSENASVSALGYINEYIVNLTKKYLIDEPSQIVRSTSFDDVKSLIARPDRTYLREHLINQIGHHKPMIGDGTNGNAQKLVINTLLLEKLKDREDLERNQRHKLILSVCVIIIPLFSNLIQFTLSYFLQVKNNSC